MFYFSFSLAFASSPLTPILLDWDVIDKTVRLTKLMPSEWQQPLVGFVELNFDGSSSGNLRELRIRGLIINHCGKVLRAHSKPTNQGQLKQIVQPLLEGW